MLYIIALSFKIIGTNTSILDFCNLFFYSKRCLTFMAHLPSKRVLSHIFITYHQNWISHLKIVIDFFLTDSHE